MEKKAGKKKLVLAKETVKNLESDNLPEVKGGICPTFDRMSCGRTTD